MGYKTWMLAIQGWADEKKDFVYDSRTQHGVVGHYTQVYYSDRMHLPNIYCIDGEKYSSTYWLWFSYLSKEFS